MVHRSDLWHQYGGDRPPQQSPRWPLQVGKSLSCPPRPVYRVQPGDTLWEIAIRFSTTVDELVRLNGIANPSLIRAGPELRLPAGPDTGSASFAGFYRRVLKGKKRSSIAGGAPDAVGRIGMPSMTSSTRSTGVTTLTSTASS